jgi:hypothetical protein
MGSGKGCVLYHPDAVRRLVAGMRADMHAAHYETLTELNVLRRELAECRAALDELRAPTLARQKAEAELASLYRERSIQRARAVERDPNAALN